ncbi:hypothetical protein [Paenibacillus sp. MMS20-IR301]|uniref:hypothetical protein n=1 Tax=Paenibacillus sp. MMS20-IR301 TaxID=2895946 RepID=UPI0028EC3314|nr:hypothetical protein [Paenibacillus sp. MMS20-IR301]WNS45347.1 hypothetical protein LOS79_08770 [Paenibacillus sp. MMS20-IR301]
MEVINVWLRNIGWLTAVTALLVLVKRRYARLALQQESGYENNEVYKAASMFAGGGPVEEVSRMLTASFEFSAEGIEMILARALPCRGDADGGYAAFVGAVNKVLGEEVYRS